MLTPFENSLLANKVQKVRDDVGRLQTELADCRAQIRLRTQAMRVLLKALEKILVKKAHFEQIMSSGMTEAYNVPYEYKLVNVEDEGLITGFKPTLKRAGGEARDPSKKYGRGAKDVQNILYSLSMLSFEHSTAPFLFVDEPFSHTSPEMQERLENLILNVCKKTGLQYVQITHQETPFGKVYHIKKRTEGTLEFSEVQEKPQQDEN